MSCWCTLFGKNSLQRPVVDPPLPGARGDADPRDRFLAAAGAERVAGHHRLARRLARRRRPAAVSVVYSDTCSAASSAVSTPAPQRASACQWAQPRFLPRTSSSALIDARSAGVPRGQRPTGTGCAGGRPVWAICVISNGTGCCAWCGWSGPAYTLSLRSMPRPSEFFGQHALDRLLDHPLRVLGQQVTIGHRAQPAGIAGVPVRPLVCPACCR